MDTSASQNAMKSLLDSAAALEDAWNSAKPAIQDAEDGGIGDNSDILARAFSETYKITAFSLARTLPHMPGNFRRLVEENQKALDAYLEANKASEQAFPGPR
jgi:hypothetical protein